MHEWVWLITQSPDPPALHMLYVSITEKIWWTEDVCWLNDSVKNTVLLSYDLKERFLELEPPALILNRLAVEQRIYQMAKI